MKEKKFTQYKDEDMRISFSVMEDGTFHGKSLIVFSKTKAEWDKSHYLRHSYRFKYVYNKPFSMGLDLS